MCYMNKHEQFDHIKFPQQQHEAPSTISNNYGLYMFYRIRLGHVRPVRSIALCIPHV